jgi:formylglycine-generating enzyme required for sulfatase activity
VKADPPEPVRRWPPRFTIGALALVLVVMLLSWWLLFPDEFRLAVRVVRDCFQSAPPPPPEEVAQVSTARPPGPAPEGMVWVPGGSFWMGSEEFPDAEPVHIVHVGGLWMDRTEVTNEQFAAFVKATEYVTVAERRPNAKDFPHLRPERLGFQQEYAPELLAGFPTAFPGVAMAAPGAGFPAALPWGMTAVIHPIVEPFSLVFFPPPLLVGLDDHTQWWQAVRGACWRHPEGPGSDLKGREKHPVVHVCYDDAVAYCKWAKKRLPTEAEWEFAARGGLDRKPYCWGDEAKPGGKCMANVWQGEFPVRNTLEDGFEGTAPVGSFPPNGYGLHDMAGNVWEWCADWYGAEYYRDSPKYEPQGPAVSCDPHEPGVPKRVQRGGSFLCCDNYCMRYVPGARGKGEPTSAASHVGFRCVRSAE